MDSGGNVGVVINGYGRGEEEFEAEEQEHEEEDGNSVAESFTSEKDRQDLEVTMIDIEGKKQRQMGGRGFARNSGEGFGHQMTASAPPAMTLPRRRASTDYHSTKEMGSLKRQLAELQTLVDAYERTSTPRNNRFALSAGAAGGVAADTGSTISDMSFTESRHPRMKGADNLLAEMSEQLQLQKELHLRRKDLEKLMKKDMMENIQKEHAEADDEDEMTRTSSDVRSEASLGTGSRHPRRRRRGGGGGGGGGSDGVNARLAAGSLGAWLNSNLVAANVPRRLRQRSVSSNNSLSGFALEPASAAAAQIQVLQHQVDKLQMEISILNQTATLRRRQRRMNGGGSADFLESASSMAAAANNHLRSDEDDVRLQLQQHHIQLLTQSLSQCYQTVLSVQQDVGMLQCTVEKLIQNQQELAQQQQQQRSQQQVSNSSSAIGLGQPQQQNGNAPQQQENSPSARQSHSHPSMQVDDLNRGRAFETWQPCNVGDQEFVPILPMPAAAIAAPNAEQQQHHHHHHHQTQSLSFAASTSDNVTTAAAFPETILGSIEANNAQWIGASQPQETLAIVSHPPPPPPQPPPPQPQPQVDEVGLWSLQQQTQQAALSLRNGLNQWSGEQNIRHPTQSDHSQQQPTPVALNNQVAPPMRANK